MKTEQRWRSGKDSFVPPSNLFRSTNYGVEEISEAKAKHFIETHHYSKSYPAARFRAGLFSTGGKLCGVAVFSQPIQQKVVPKYAPLTKPNDGIELGRFVLLDEVGFNGETWFLSRAFKLLKKAKNPSVVISYSDPVERKTIDGVIIKPGHIGTIYKAFNGKYFGRSAKRKLLLTPKGTVLSPRALSKLRSGHQGKEYAYKQLISNGAPEREYLEDIDKYINRIKKYFREVSHPGNHVYGWSLDGSVMTKSINYPKRENVL